MVIGELLPQPSQFPLSQDTESDNDFSCSGDKISAFDRKRETHKLGGGRRFRRSAAFRPDNDFTIDFASIVSARGMEKLLEGTAHFVSGFTYSKEHAIFACVPKGGVAKIIRFLGVNAAGIAF